MAFGFHCGEDVFKSEGLVGLRWDRSGIEVGLLWDCGGIVYSGGRSQTATDKRLIDGSGGIQAHTDVLVGIYDGFSPERVCLGAIGWLHR